MSVVLGSSGNVRLRRSSGGKEIVRLSASIKDSDINTTLNRVGFDKSIDNILTGDRVEITTSDTRGLAFFDQSTWLTEKIEKTFSGFVNVNAVGGLRFFPTMEDAVNNTRANEYNLNTLADSTPLDISVALRDTIYNLLGNVTAFQFNTDREAVEVTALNDKFKKQYSAGLISGSGSIDCLFNSTTTGIKEAPVLMLQMLQRIDVGSEIDLALYVLDNSDILDVGSVFYETTACVTRAGVNVASGDLVTCTIDFVTTGEIRLLIGQPVGYLVGEGDTRILLEHSADFLVQEETD